MKIEISSSFDAVFDINGEKHEMIKNASTLEIQLLESELFHVTVYPQGGKKMLPYVATIKNQNGKIIAKSQYVKILNFENDFTSVVFNPFKLSGFSFSKIEKEKFSLTEIMLFQGEQNMLCVDFQGEMFFKDIDFPLNNYVIKEIKGCPYLLAKTAKNKFFCTFCLQNNTFFAYKAISVDVYEDSVVLVCDQENFSKHALEVTLSFNQGEKIMENKELLYLNAMPNKTNLGRVVPLAFFDALMQKDFALARFYLAEPLALSISNDALLEYFDEFEEVVPYNFSSLHGYFAGIRFKNKTKVFKFKIENGKILEIDLLKELS